MAGDKKQPLRRRLSGLRSEPVAVEWCKARGLTFDTVNANLPELIDLYKNDCRKINADIYIDDKAVNPVPYRHAAGMFGFNPYANPIDKAEFEKRRSNHVEKN